MRLKLSLTVLLCFIAAWVGTTCRAYAWTASPMPLSLDRSFGDDGRVLTKQGDHEAGPGRFYSVVESSDGQVFLADSHTLLTLRPDGSPDSRLGPDGSISLESPLQRRFRLAALAIDRRDRVLVAGTTEAPVSPSGAGIEYQGERSTSLVLLFRFRPDGEPDRRFGSDGALVTDLGLPPPLDRTGESGAMASSLDLAGMAFDRDGRIWLTGSYLDDARATCQSGGVSQDIAFFARLNADGTPDPTFGENGSLVDPDLSSAWNPIPLRRGGVDFLASRAGACPGNVPVGVGRLNDQGIADPSFSTDGWRSISGDLAPLDLAVDRFGRAVILLPSYASGTSGAPAKSRRRNESIASVLRLRRDGSRDRHFGGNGTSIVRLPTRQGRLDELAIDGRGRAFLAGTVGGRARTGFGRLFVTRLRADGSRDSRLGQISTGFGAESVVSSARMVRSANTILLAGPILGPQLSGGRGFALCRYRISR